MRQNFEYHDVCMWLPHRPETIADIANDINKNGYREDRPIILYEGKILDGRHRYEAAKQVDVEPIFTVFEGTRTDAIDFVTSENVNRRHLKDEEKYFFYHQRAEELGVQPHGGTGSNQYQSADRSFDTSAPTQQEHADALGVSKPTIKRWEKDRKEIKADPVLSEKAKTFEGLKEAKKEIKERRKATKEEEEKIKKLKNLAEKSEVEAGNVEIKLDKYRSLGVDVDAVKSQGDKDSAREEYRERQKPIEDMANEIARILIDNKDYSFVATLAIATYAKPGELEHAYTIIKEDSEK